MFLVLVVIAIAVTVLAFVQVVRMGWRVLRGEEEFEPGGSMGRQMYDRHEDPPQ